MKAMMRAQKEVGRGLLTSNLLYCAFLKRSNSIITAVLCTEALLLLTWKLQGQSLNRLALTATTNVLALVVDHY